MSRRTVVLYRIFVITPKISQKSSCAFPVSESNLLKSVSGGGCSRHSGERRCARVLRPHASNVNQYCCCSYYARTLARPSFSLHLSHSLTLSLSLSLTMSFTTSSRRAVGRMRSTISFGRGGCGRHFSSRNAVCPSS